MDKPLLVSLIISITGILLLLLLSPYIQPKEANNYSDLQENTLVQVHGKIISIKTYSNYDDFSIIRLDKNITVICNCKFPVNTSVRVLGRVEEYNNELQINANKIQILS
jgi:hypothetical protein